MNREDIAINFKSKRICEVGVLRGVFAGLLLKADPDELHLVDPWKVYDKYVYKNYHKSTQEDWDKRYNCVRKKFSGDSRVKIHRGTSVEVAETFPDQYFDLVYIDANHAYEFVSLDILLWMPKIKKGGVIAGHDIEITSVRTAVEETFGKEYRTTDEYDENTVENKLAKSWYAQQ